MGKKHYYVVWKGRNPGVYDRWEDCKREIDGFSGALYKGFENKTAAETAFNQGFTGFDRLPKDQAASVKDAPVKPVSPAIAVDAACSGNPGKMEYQGVFIDCSTDPITTADLFKSPLFEEGTNNIGEFLAIVHALAWQQKTHQHLPIYSDSVNGQKWIRERKCKTKLQPNQKNAYLFEVIQRAENWLITNDLWLKENANTIPILKWKTELWGEIPADFGRK